MNKVVLIGRVGKTPEVTTHDGGKKTTKFPLATTEFFGKDGKETTWHNIVVWGEYGETMSKYIASGSQIGVEGRIQNSIYEKENTKVVYSTIVVDKIELLDKKSDSTSEPSSSIAQPRATASASASVPPSDGNDDLPF